MAVKADRKQNTKHFNPQLLLFQAWHRREQQAKCNAKDDARTKAKAAAYLEEDSDEEDGENEKTELSDNEDDSDHYNEDCPMNAFALYRNNEQNICLLMTPEGLI
jgi:hypothetical protein